MLTRSRDTNKRKDTSIVHEISGIGMEASKPVLNLSLLIILLCNFHSFLARKHYVKNFGAKGNGRTDDTNAIRKALAAAERSYGGRVIFGRRYTFLTGPFNVTSNVTLVIKGKILGSNQSSAYS